MAESSYMIAPGDTSDNLAMRRRLALALAQKNMQAPQIDHWTQGLAHLADNAYSGFEMAKLERDDRAERDQANKLMAALFAGGQTPSAPAAAPASAAGFGDAIASIESGGKYDALGPVTKSGDRAYGKYQVMGANVPEWTQAHLGRKMTPEEFLADSKAQDAVFQGQFGQYAQKYGPEGAARAWFAGEGGMNDLGRKDQLGTTVGQYGQKFAQALQTPSGPVPAVNRDAVIQMLGNRRTAPFAQKIISDQVAQQFKPSEYDFKPRDDGSIVAINKKNPRDMQVIQPGNPQDLIRFGADKKAAETRAEALAKQQVAKESGRAGEVQQANVVVQDIDRALGKITETPIRTTGAVGSMLSGVPNTEAHNVAKLIETVKANAGFDQLNKMRQASPTGGALGNVTEQEIAYLQSTIGNLAQSQDAKQLADNLRRVKNAYLDVIHGQGNGPAREKLQFMEPKASDGGTAPAGVDPKLWKHMTPEERKLWQ